MQNVNSLFVCLFVFFVFFFFFLLYRVYACSFNNEISVNFENKALTEEFRNNYILCDIDFLLNFFLYNYLQCYILLCNNIWH